jgi:hypothetical protein
MLVFLNLVSVFHTLSCSLVNGVSLFSDDAIMFAEWTGLMPMLQQYREVSGDVICIGRKSYSAKGLMDRYMFLKQLQSRRPAGLDVPLALDYQNGW